MNYVKTPIVDVLGGLLADKADVSNEVKSAQALLIGMATQNPDVVVFEGDLFRATVSTAIRTDSDKDAVIAYLALKAGFSEDALARLMEKHQSTKMVTTVRCTARKGV